MKKLHFPTLTMLLVVMAFFQFSCSKDSDLLLEYVSQENEIPDAQTTPDVPQNPSNNNDNNAPNVNDANRPNDVANWFPNEPSVSKPVETETYTPSSSSDITNVQNAGKTAIISNSFDCSGCTFAANQIIRPAGGTISGENINLNGSYIDNIADRAFSSSVTFNSIYEDSWVFPEVFGAIANDNSDDSDAITALMKNVKFAKAVSSATYIKNTPKFVHRKGEFIFDLSNGKIEITSDANYNETSDQQAMFWFFELNVKFINGEIDGNDLYPAAFRWAFPEAYHFENLHVHHFKNDGVSHRSIAFNVKIASAGTNSWNGGSPFGTKSSSQQFQNGYVGNCVIEDIRAVGVGVPNGVAQAWWIQYDNMDTSLATIYHTGNLIQRVLGDEGEGIYLNDETFSGGNKDIIHGTTFVMDNCEIRDCTDRAMKITTSNVTLKNSTFRPISAVYGKPSGGATVDFFTLLGSNYPTHYTNNVTVQNCSFIESESPRAMMLRIGNCKNISVTENTFSYPDLGNYQGIVLGASGTSGTNGWVTDANFSANTFFNCGYEISNTITTDGTLNIHDETFSYDMTGTGGSSQAVFRTPAASGTHADINIYNLAIDVDMNGENIPGFKGLIFSNGANFVGTTWSNINLNYKNEFTNNSTNGSEFGFLKGNFDNTNSLNDIIMTNALGTGSIIILGSSKGFLSSNARDDKGNKITLN
ncbi:hypothetical protein SAMN06265375_103113 [Muriicola jejuensis]|uniref:Right-handed parallel beta-helix repeat-containing protein n=1 Tax=Muriicola jejuensis TaxID=504488 RepID=A0A6P0UE24_9FLAO|nr:hypothetical protein [Muriicola jejuensis]NER11521.1 hypothetical protein [Muriicola jejuensis]SMP20142.1 hypothetical protein SAMN06265375_103113 [Muriicola jejuensis]